MATIYRRAGVPEMRENVVERELRNGEEKPRIFGPVDFFTFLLLKCQKLRTYFYFFFFCFY